MHASNAWSDDIHTLRKKGIRFILKLDGNFNMASFDPPLDPEGDMAQRGWKHRQTARMLTPRRSLADFDRDPEYVCSHTFGHINCWPIYRAYMDGVSTGAIKITAQEFPTFMYDLSVPYDPDDRAQGLMRGIPLVRAR
jgi:hypothetical protein